MTSASAGSPTGARPEGARSRSDNIAVGRKADAPDNIAISKAVEAEREGRRQGDDFTCHACEGSGGVIGSEDQQGRRLICPRCDGGGVEPKARKLSEVRKEAQRLALEAADERENCGDPEGADVIRDLAAEIAKIPLRTHTSISEVVG